jgi:hypothetical protein
LELKEGWRVQTELKCIEGWVSIQTEYWRGNGDAIGFTYNEKEGIASDDSETEFEVGTCKDSDWHKDKRVKAILEDNKIGFDYVDSRNELSKEINSVGDLYTFGKVLWEIDQLF